MKDRGWNRQFWPFLNLKVLEWNVALCLNKGGRWSLSQDAAAQTGQLFLVRATELEAYRFYSKRNDWKVDMVAPEQSSFPDEEDFEAFLTSFRQFFLRRESVYLDKVWDAALHLTESVEERSVLTQSRISCSRNRQRR